MKHHSYEQGYDMPPMIWVVSVWAVILLLLPISQSASAQSAQDDKGKSEMAVEKRNSEIINYVRNKYKVQDIHSEMQKTEHGLAGSIFIIGDMTPKNIGPAGADTTKSDRARDIAKTLILGEPDIFSAIKQHELREAAMKTGEQGTTIIRYQRTINNIPLSGMDIIVHVGHDESVSYVSARTVPIPPALEAEATRDTLREDALLPIIEDDLRASNAKYNILKVLGNKKVAITAPPYIVWISDVMLLADTARWIYKIDAFTGKVIEKRDALVE